MALRIIYQKTISTVPEGDQPLWQKVDAQLLSLLWQAIELTLMPIFRPLWKCNALWTRVRELYTSDITRIYDVIGALLNLRQTDLDMTTYLGKFQAFIRDFNELMPF